MQRCRAGRLGAGPSLALQTWGHVLSYVAPLTPPGISVRKLVLHNIDSVHSETAISDVTGSLGNWWQQPLSGAYAYPIAGEVVASTAAMQAAMGSGHEFDSLGEHEPKGIAGPWAVHRVSKPAGI